MGNSLRISVTYLILFTIAVPWYWRFAPDESMRLVWGVPLWVLTAVASSAAISLFTAWQLSYRWPGESADE